MRPIAVFNKADGVVTPQACPAQHDIVAVTGVDDVVHRKERLGAGRPHVNKDQTAVLRRRVCGYQTSMRLRNS